MKTIAVGSPSRTDAPSGSLRTKLQMMLPRIVLAPSFALVLVFVYGFNL